MNETAADQQDAIGHSADVVLRWPHRRGGAAQCLGLWGALLAATNCGWLHHLTATTRGGRLVGHGVRGGQAMIATLRWRLIAVPARLVRHARGLTLRLPPDDQLLAEVLARLRALPDPS